MRVGILSDTHDRLSRTIRAVAALQAQKVEVLLHCGDLTGSNIVHACGVLPCMFVLGNNDDDETGLRAAIEAIDGKYLGMAGEVVLAGKRLAITHGDNPRLVRKLLAEKPDYLLFGHSHHRHDRHEGATRCINPGALHRASVYSVAVLDIETDTLRFLTIDP